MKLFVRKTLHRCEFYTWNASPISDGTTSDRAEGAKACYMEGVNGGLGSASYDFPEAPLNLTGYSYLYYYNKYDANISEHYFTIDSGGTRAWWTVTAGTTWALRTIDLSSPDSGAITLTDISKMAMYGSFTASGNVLMVDNFYVVSPDREAYAETCTFSNGVFPFFSEGKIIAHPDNKDKFPRKEILDIQGDSGSRWFYGPIIRNDLDYKRLARITAENANNEILFFPYVSDYSAKLNSEIQEDMLDQMNYCDYSSTIDATSLTYSYNLRETTGFMFNNTRYMEKDVISQDPNGITSATSFGGLTVSGESWTQANSNVVLVALPGMTQFEPAFYRGETGITRATVRGGFTSQGEIYRTYTAADAGDEDEGMLGVKPLKLWEDVHLLNDSMALQLATNLYTIFTQETKFLNVLGEGLGFLQPGQTVTYENTKYGISAFTAMIASYLYDAKNDNYLQMILTDNIVHWKEWNEKRFVYTDAMVRSAFYRGNTESTSSGTAAGTYYGIGELMANYDTSGNSIYGNTKIDIIEYTGDGIGDSGGWGSYQTLTLVNVSDPLYVTIVNKAVNDGDNYIQGFTYKGWDKMAQHYQNLHKQYNNRCRIFNNQVQINDTSANFFPNTLNQDCIAMVIGT